MQPKRVNTYQRGMDLRLKGRLDERSATLSALLRQLTELAGGGATVTPDENLLLEAGWVRDVFPDRALASVDARIKNIITVRHLEKLTYCDAGWCFEVQRVRGTWEIDFQCFTRQQRHRGEMIELILRTLVPELVHLGQGQRAMSTADAEVFKRVGLPGWTFEVVD
jgi:hypothetical protein